MRILLLIFIISWLSNDLFCQLLNDTEVIYNKEIVYNYKVKRIDSNNVLSEINLYLVCYGIPWAVDSLIQIKVNWAYNSKGIFEKTVGTGVIENSKRIWMHPPRQDKFSILEYSPFPYVKFPILINSRWNWKLSLGKYWENEALGVQADDIMKYEYKVESEVSVDFRKENIKCYKIVANSTNPKFKSRLESYYSHKYGFIELKYFNIDNSEFHFKLVEVGSRNKFKYLDSFLAY